VSDFDRSNFPTTLSMDMFQLFCGDLIGEGIARRVYQHALDPNLVVKIEDRARSFQNVFEWQVWDRVREAKGIAAWFAPCEAISPCGAILIQRRTAAARESEHPARVPTFFTDLKRSNWGLIGKRLVCHDYGSHLMLENGMTSRSKRADWWD